MLNELTIPMSIFNIRILEIDKNPIPEIPIERWSCIRLN